MRELTFAKQVRKKLCEMSVPRLGEAYGVERFGTPYASQGQILVVTSAIFQIKVSKIFEGVPFSLEVQDLI